MLGRRELEKKKKRNRRGMQRKFRAKSAQEETPYPFTACTHPAHHILLFLLKEKESQVLFLLFLSKMFDQQEASAILTTENYACCASRNGYVHRKKKRKRGKKALVLLPFFFFSLSPLFLRLAAAAFCGSDKQFLLHVKPIQLGTTTCAQASFVFQMGHEAEVTRSATFSATSCMSTRHRATLPSLLADANKYTSSSSGFSWP